MRDQAPTTHYDDYDDDFEECYECGGEGYVYDCMDEIGCVDPEGGCDYCERRCPVCKGKRAA